MNPQLEATVIGGVIAAAAGLIAGGLGAWNSARLARKQREHDRDERRYDDLKSVYVRFCLEMRELITTAGQDRYDNQGKNYAEANWHSTEPLTHLRAGDLAEKLLAELRLFADDRLYAAARGWLDAYYVQYWDARREGVTGDVESAEELVLAEGKRALHIPDES